MTKVQLVQIDIKEKQVFQILKLQELFHSQYLTQELLNGMISLYVKFIENIHYNQHPLRIYFMERIKFVLSRSEIIKLLEKKSIQKNQNMRQTIRGMVGVTEEQQIEIKKIAEEAKEEVRQNHFINMKKARNFDKTEKGQQLREKERNIKIQMQVQIMEQVQQNMLKMKKDMMNKAQQQKNKENEINKIVQKQDLALNERLARRKKKLRKKSVQFQQKEVIQIEQAPLIAKNQLLQMKKELNQTYQRFTRLTMNKAKRTTQMGKENEGRIKVRLGQEKIQQEDLFDQLQNQKIAKLQQPISFLKVKKVSQQQFSPAISKQKNKSNKPEQLSKNNEKQREGDSTIEYKAFDQNKGRVTIRQKKYEQIEEEQLF